MKSILIRLASLTFLLVSMTFGGTPALAQEAIGLILSASGTVTAEDQSGNSRQLTRRSPVYEGDTISTAARSRAQIRFNDNGLLALQPETSFIIEQHQFQGQEDGTESATYRLVRGGLQSITGLIGNTNKENYRVETPVATIGLRGTHWAATMCTSECAGNPPGLYGGVADGGIDVCNGGGCAAVETDSYFYAPDANTQPQLLLAPPSVVFSDSATSDEEEEAAEEADESEAGANEGDDSGDETEVAETETQTSAPDDTSSFVASRVDDVDPSSDLAREFGSNEGVEVEAVVSESGDSLARDTDVILDDIVDSGDPGDNGDPGDVVDELGPREVSNPTIVLAQNGSVATFASAFDDQGTPLSINTVVIPGNGGDRIGLTTLTDIGTTVTALDFFDLQDAGCQPCLFALAPGADQSAELQEFTAGTLGSANYSIGRWLGDAALSDTGELLNALDNHHFAFSDGLSSSLPAFNLPTIAHYSLVDATLPTDGAGVTGTLDTAALDIDFYEQLITDFDMAMTFGARQVTSSLLEPVSLAHPSSLVVAARDVSLSGLCNGGSCGSQLALEGSSSLAFIGSNAEGILGSFSLNGSQQSGQSFAGAFVLGQDSTETRPDYYNGIPAGTATPTGAVGAFASQILDGNSDDGPGGISFAAFTDPGLEIEQTLATSTINGVANVLTGFHYEPGEYEEREGELVWELAELSIDDAFLIENGSTTLGGSVPANWGIWRTPGGVDLINNANTQLLGPYLHYAYAESVTPSTYAPAPISQLAYYSLAGGTSPTDLGDRLGTLNSVNLTLDYYQQAITAFDLSATIANASYMASMAGIEYLDGDWQDLELDLFGSCSGGDCGQGVNLSGESSLSFVGSEAEGVLGHFSLNNLGNSIGAYGVYALEESEIVAPHPFVTNTLPNVQPAPNGSYATFVSFFDSYSAPAISNLEQGLVEDGYSGAITEDIGLITLAGTGNIVASINDAYSRFDGYYGYDLSELNIALTSSSEQQAILVETGGIENFAGTGRGVNWGRWNALANVALEEYGYTYNLSGMHHHYGFYDGPVVDTPTFANPSVATYSWAGGTSPTNEYGQAGAVNLFEVDLDFFNQSVTRVDLQLSIDDRSYSAHLPDLTGLYYGGIASYYATDRGIPFEILDIYGGYVPIIGSCQGGDCDGYVGYRTPQLANTDGTPLGGAVALNLIGDGAEGLMGGYYLTANYSFDRYSCGYYSCYDAAVANADYIYAMGTAVLQRGEIEDSPYWVTSAPVDSDPLGGASTLSYLAFDSSNNILEPVSLPDGTGFRTATVAGIDDVISQVSDLSGSSCLSCTIQISDAVLIQSGQTTHPYAFLENPATASWGAWESLSPGWMAGASAGDFFEFSYTEDLAVTLPDRPLTNFNTYVYYEFAGGPSPITGSGLHYQIDNLELELNFATQTIDDFYADYWFETPEGSYSWFELWLAYPGSVSIIDPDSGNIMPVSLDLDGQCYNCAMDENFYYLNANGVASLIFAGEQAEVALGSLVGWTLADGGIGNVDFDFTIQHSFVLHQSFDDHWVINPETEVAPTGGALAAATLALPDGALGFSFSGEIGQNGISAELTNVVSEFNYDPHDHPNSVTSFTTDMASWAGATGCSDSGCSWQLTEGQIQHYDNNLNDSSRDFDVYWGRWMHQDDINVDGSNVSTNDYTQFAYSPDVTEVVPTSGVITYSNMTSGYYGLAADAGGVHGYVNTVDMEINFGTQQVTSFDVSATVNFNNYLASEVDPVSLSGGPSAMIELSGTCSGSGSCGSGIGIGGASSITLIGPNAEGALGAFDLTSDGGGYGVSGVFVLEGAPVIP